MIGCGLLLGGYNKLWRMSSGAAKVLTRGPETFRGRVSDGRGPECEGGLNGCVASQLVSNGLFAASTFTIMVTTELVSSRVYQRFTSVPVQDGMTAMKEIAGSISTAFRTVYGQDDPKRLQQATRWPDWMNWGLTGLIGTVIVGIPVLMAVAVYERLGPKAVKPMTKVLVVAVGCTG